MTEYPPEQQYTSDAGDSTGRMTNPRPLSTNDAERRYISSYVLSCIRRSIEPMYKWCVDHQVIACIWYSNKGARWIDYCKQDHTTCQLMHVDPDRLFDFMDGETGGKMRELFTRIAQIKAVLDETYRDSDIQESYDYRKTRSQIANISREEHPYDRIHYEPTATEKAQELVETMKGLKKRNLLR